MFMMCLWGGLRWFRRSPPSGKRIAGEDSDIFVQVDLRNIRNLGKRLTSKRALAKLFQHYSRIRLAMVFLDHHIINLNGVQLSLEPKRTLRPLSAR